MLNTPMGLPLASRTGVPAEFVRYQVFVYGKADGKTYRLVAEVHRNSQCRAGTLTAAADAHQLTYAYVLVDRTSSLVVRLFPLTAYMHGKGHA